MSRVSNNVESPRTPNPATRYLEWKSKEKCFSFYNRDTGKEELIKLPFKFALLEQYHTVRGWDDSTDSRIFGNEVLYLGTQEIRVMSYKGGKLLEGLYNTIKADVLRVGGKYHRSLYIVLEDGTLCNLVFKGSAVKEWTDFVKESKKGLFESWIEIKEAEEKKKGSIKYTTPVFELGSKITKKHDVIIDEAANAVATYFNEQFKTEAPQQEPEQVEDLETVDDEIDF